jgi:hypothetical protein
MARQGGLDRRFACRGIGDITALHERVAPDQTRSRFKGVGIAIQQHRDGPATRQFQCTGSGGCGKWANTLWRPYLHPG